MNQLPCLAELAQLPSPAARPAGWGDYSELSQSFVRELRYRTQNGVEPPYLLLDVVEGGTAVSLAAHALTHQHLTCFRQLACGRGEVARGEAGHCFARADEVRYELILSCHSLSYLRATRARCLLRCLRAATAIGGMLFVSALGRYSRLGDCHPRADDPLDDRYAELVDAAAFGLAPGTRLCLYSERDLCGLLFDAGWSVLRSATTSESNVMATAIRL